MRLIDADALKEEFTCNCDEWICNIIDNEPTIEPKTKVIAQVTFDDDKLREIVHEAVERIKEEYDIVDNPDAVSVEWIPCEERLPSEDGEYLVTWGEGFVSAFYYGKPTNYRHKEVKGKCFYEYNDEYGDAVCNDAIAWMPLPKPYGEREGE